MPHIVEGDLWNELGTANVILVTGNSKVTPRGDLVMGAGAALQAKTRFPTLPRILGKHLLERGLSGGVYRVLIPGLRMWELEGGREVQHAAHVGVFQTKVHPEDFSGLGMVATSCEALSTLSTLLPMWRFALNFPGIGLGGLSRGDVLPLLRTLPSNVWVYEYPKRPDDQG